MYNSVLSSYTSGEHIGSTERMSESSGYDLSTEVQHRHMGILDLLHVIDGDMN